MRTGHIIKRQRDDFRSVGCLSKPLYTVSSARKATCTFRQIQVFAEGFVYMRLISDGRMELSSGK